MENGTQKSAVFYTGKRTWSLRKLDEPKNTIICVILHKSLIDFYILIWINETDEIQYDSGSYTGIVRFEDSNGKGVTARFGS